MPRRTEILDGKYKNRTIRQKVEDINKHIRKHERKASRLEEQLSAVRNKIADLAERKENLCPHAKTVEKYTGRYCVICHKLIASYHIY